jgi:hypothetical protein
VNRMPELDFQIESCAPVLFAASPALSFRLHITNASVERIHTAVLRCQIQIEVTRRKYTPEEQIKLRDLFGEPERWSQTLRTLLWTHVGFVAPAFQHEAVIDLQAPCTFDFNVGATKYFYGVEDGNVPLLFQFSGSVFYESAEGALLVTPISWDKEATFKLPIKVWREMMDIYYPNSAWLCLRKDIFDRIYQYKVLNGIPTWEQALESLLSSLGNAAREGAMRP